MLQNTLIAGDTLNFATTVADYPASASWVLKYRLIPRTSSNPAISFSSAADGDDHRVQIAAATTAGWAADNYTWNSWVELGAEKYTVDNGQVAILADPRLVAAGYDGRSAAQVGLDAVRAMLRGTASAGVQKYAIQGRSLERYSIEELISLESKLVAQVKAEQRAAALAAGLADNRKVLVRIPRA